MERFLKSKHWQIFLLQVGLPIVLTIIMIISVAIIAISHRYESEPPSELFRVIGIFYPLIMIVSVGSLLVWQWSVGIGLQRFIPEHAKMRIKLFKACIIVPAIYFGILLIIVWTVMMSLPDDPSRFRPNPIYLILLILIIPMHLFTIFSMFHNMVFVAKAIKTAELQRPLTFGDYALEFVMTWFLFVGIWFLQPRVNKLVNEPVKTEL
jgi:hypothetical protein